MSKQSKIDQLVSESGFEADFEAAESYMFDSVCPCICTNEGCSFTEEWEPDCSGGNCPECKTDTVSSLLVLMGVI